MKVLHLNAGNETGGGMHHILLLLNHLNKEECILGVFEEGEISKRAKQSGIQTIIFQQSTRLDMSIISEIADFIKKEGIDIIHTHGARANLFGTMLKRKTGCKWISTIHSDPRDDFLGQGLKGQVFTYLNLRSIKKADHLLAISERFKNMLVDDIRIKQEKVSVILNGIEFDCLTDTPLKREDFGIEKDDFLIIMVARLEKVKDHLTALKALKIALESNNSIKLMLIGDGKEKQFLLEQISHLGLQEHIKVLGHRNDAKHFYPLADIALLTSKSESFPLVLLEAANAGIPAISTDVGGVRRMIPNEVHGWVNQVNDYEGIAQSIMLAKGLKDSNQLHIMGELFQEHCKNNFSIENQVRDVYQSYLKLMS